MFSYEVQVEVEAFLAEGFQRYMVLKHIPEILATGCFSSISFDRGVPGRFRTRYLARTQEDLERYMEQHTKRFREDVLNHFPTGVTPKRETWETIQRWDA